MKLSQAEIEAQLTEVRRSYIASLEQKHEAIAMKWVTLCEQWDHETYQSLYLIIHSLAGSAETFGLADITRDARRVLHQFKLEGGQPPLAAPTIATITTDIEQLAATMKSALSQK